MSVVEDLKVAKAEIEKGWHQGSLSNGTSVCAVGALNIACTGALIGSANADWGRRNKAYDAVEKCLPSEFVGDLVYFNDRPDTTKQDVLNLFEKTLADLGGLGD